jgi:hypothetical protein
MQLRESVLFALCSIGTDNAQSLHEWSLPVHKMRAIVITLSLIGSGVPICLAGQTVASPEKQLDFWVGEWTVTDTTPKAKNPVGKNVIQKLYGGKVIHESFKMGTFEGQSWSAYNPKLKNWQQTWVDNSGGYIAMTSKVVGGKLAIQTLTRTNAPLTANRMIFSDVKPDSFNWRWEATKDGGKTWTLSWQLRYTRVKDAEDFSRSLMKAMSIQNRFNAWR